LLLFLPCVGLDVIIGRWEKSGEKPLWGISSTTTQVSRRQACQIGATFGLGLCLPLLSFRTGYGLDLGNRPPEVEENTMKLMQPIVDGKVSVEKTILERRTVSEHEPILIMPVGRRG
jgi:hypothetical protein